MKALNDVLYLIATALLAPVIIALLLLLGWTLLLLGGFMREALYRRRVRQQLESLVTAARGGTDICEQMLRSVSSDATGLLERWLRFVGTDFYDEHIVDHAIAELENDVTSTLARLTFITRVSPMLGLMGTLIPLGPALSGLAAGNMQTLAGNLVVAFTATVVGLLVSGASYAISITRRCWYAHDMASLEFISKQMTRQAETAPDLTQKAKAMAYGR
jgi:biopolymer transport protein ExbB/TolQ